jgi:hypothetical protein
MKSMIGYPFAIVFIVLMTFGVTNTLAQENDKRCYFGECPEDSTPRVAPPPTPAPTPAPTPTPAPDDLPRYCCTLAGALGPYPNPGPYGPAPVGSECFGMAADGLLYAGAACHGNEDSYVDDRPLPAFCCTVVGRLGPFTNPGIREGEVCSAPTAYGPVGGVACY